MQHIEALGDPLGVLSHHDSPADYYLRVKQYAEGRHSSQSLRKLQSFVLDLHTGGVDFKSAAKARNFREQGNKLFALGEYDGAADCYRQGLLFTPNAFDWHTGSKEAALLHGNLSATLRHQSEWAACAWETCLALRLHNDLDGPIRKRLQARLRDACNKLGQDVPTDSEDCFTWITKYCGVTSSSHGTGERYGEIVLAVPKYGRHEKVHAFSSRLGIRKSPEKGRYVVCEGEFTAGDVLASEPAGGWPAASQSPRVPPVEERAVASCILLPSQRHKRCFACHNRLSSVGYVCPNCNDAAFCGPPSRCFAKRFTSGHYNVPQWHKDECGFIFLLNSIGLGHLSYRLATLRGVLGAGIKTSLDTLIDNFHLFPSLFEYALTGWLCGSLLEYVGLPNCGEWCFQVLRQLQCNAHALTEVNTTLGVDVATSRLAGFRQERIGCGLFPAVSLINHSCESNITYQFMAKNGTFVNWIWSKIANQMLFTGAAMAIKHRCRPIKSINTPR
uniref:2Fe-2S ferredoxin-type domain-containing protein n=1 Tax=Mesocestoides corti TaxID=53468 RepID=A0A5K3FMX3_MESCO